MAATPELGPAWETLHSSYLRVFGSLLVTMYVIRNHEMERNEREFPRIKVN